MPKIKSAKKALRQNIRRRARNLAKKDAFKTAVKTVKNLVGAKKIDEAKTALSRAYKALDKSAKAGVIKKNAASRLKSKLAQLIARSIRASS